MMKTPSSVVIRGAISIKGTAGLFFLEPETAANDQKYLNLIKEKLQLLMSVHDYMIFMR